ncbi:MAG: T9SS type A sorting domain-containing protein [bacterium]|nr:T9SS type A sorting domain-containing protein [bacterium]
MYPNPVKDKLMINGMPDDAFVRLITLSGKVLDQGIGRKEFDMSALQNGLYLLHVTIDDEARTFKVIRN